MIVLVFVSACCWAREGKLGGFAYPVNRPLPAVDPRVLVPFILQIKVCLLWLAAFAFG